jgi:mRNA interferase RelE/StbE
MGKYKIIFRKSVAQDMRRIPNRDLRRILAAIDSLSEEPRPSGVERLSVQEKYRVRQGNYRIIYEINDKEAIVAVVKVGHRKDVCRRSQLIRKDIA